MQRPIHFCDGWFAAKKFATEVWTEAQAKDAHHSGRNYTVLVDSVDRPSSVILVMARAVVVDFMDEHLREVVSYQFQVVPRDRMFLTRATHREFDGGTDKVAKGISYKFTENGKLRIDRETFLPEHNVEVAHGHADVSSNYEAIPKFGEYEAFMRIERQLS